MLALIKLPFQRSTIYGWSSTPLFSGTSGHPIWSYRVKFTLRAGIFFNGNGYYPFFFSFCNLECFTVVHSRVYRDPARCMMIVLTILLLGIILR